MIDEYSQALLDAVDDAVPRWVDRCVRTVAAAQAISLDDAAEQRLLAVAVDARDDVVARLRQLLETDVDEQRSNPLDVLRRSVHHATALLLDLGALPVQRDEFAQRVFPDDVFGLGPAAFADVDESLTEPGIIWGAYKAKTVLDRRRAEGRLPGR